MCSMAVHEGAGTPRRPGEREGMQGHEGAAQGHSSGGQFHMKEPGQGPICYHRCCPHGCTFSLEVIGQLIGQFDKETRAEGKSGPEQIWGGGGGGSELLSLPTLLHTGNWIKATSALPSDVLPADPSTHHPSQHVCRLSVFHTLFIAAAQHRAPWQLLQALVCSMAGRLPRQEHGGLLLSPRVPRAS